MSDQRNAVPPLLRSLFDDAAVFPPGEAAVADAVPAHHRHLASAHAGLLGPFVFPAGRIAELAFGAPITVNPTAPDGGGDLPAALREADRTPGVRIAAVEFGPPADHARAGWIPDVIARAATLPAPIAAYVELPLDGRFEQRVATLAEAGLAAKIRTGGLVAPAYPSAAVLASAIRALVAAHLPFKATAGLHRAVRNTDPRTGFDQHGFLNVLLAVGTALAGGGRSEIAAALESRDGAAVARELTGLSDREVDAVRACFRSFGTCSIAEPLHDLRGLGLLPGSGSPDSVPNPTPTPTKGRRR